MKKATILTILMLSLATTIRGQSDRVTFHINDTTDLTLERAKFDTTGKTYEYYDNKFPFSINGKPIFGTDGDIPEYILAEAILTIGSLKYNLQVGDMYNPWFGVRPNDSSFKIKIDGSETHLFGFFSDGAGSYGAEWLIVGKSSIRTILTKDEWLLHEYIEGER